VIFKRFGEECECREYCSGCFGWLLSLDEPLMRILLCLSSRTLN